MTKSKSGMVTSGITQLSTDTLKLVVIECVYYLWLDIHYDSSQRIGNIFFTTTSRSVSVYKYAVSQVPYCKVIRITITLKPILTTAREVD